MKYLTNQFRQAGDLQMDCATEVVWSLNQSYSLLCCFSDVPQVGELFRVSHAFLKGENTSD